MRRELTLFILLCVILSCNGLLEKLLDPLNIGGTILKGISYNNKYNGGQSSADGEYSSAYEGSSASYSYGGSIGGAVNGYGALPQTYGHGEPPQRQVIQGNSYGSHLQEANHENYQQSNGFIEGEGYHSDAPHVINPGLTFNINLGGLFGLGHSKHSHHHEPKHHHGHGNSDFYPNNIPNGNINGYGQSSNQNGGYDRPEHNGYQNQDGQNSNQNGGYDRPEQIGYQNEHNSKETTYDTHHSEVINYNSGENKNPSGLYNDNPVQNNRNGMPNEGSYQSEDKYVSCAPSVDKPTEIIHVSTTESTKTPYEYEKNSKVTTSNRKTTIRPDNDQPLLVPLNPNEYIYEGDKIQIVPPKRNTDGNNQKKEINKKEEDFDIDVRFNDDE